MLADFLYLVTCIITAIALKHSYDRCFISELFLGILLNVVKVLCWHLNVCVKSLGNCSNRKCAEVSIFSYDQLHESLC